MGIAVVMEIKTLLLFTEQLPLLLLLLLFSFDNTKSGPVVFLQDDSNKRNVWSHNYRGSHKV